MFTQSLCHESVEINDTDKKTTTRVCPDQMIKVRRIFFTIVTIISLVSIASGRRSTLLSIELINNRRDMSLVGYNAANEVSKR